MRGQRCKCCFKRRARRRSIRSSNLTLTDSSFSPYSTETTAIKMFNKILYQERTENRKNGEKNVRLKNSVEAHSCHTHFFNKYKNIKIKITLHAESKDTKKPQELTQKKITVFLRRVITVTKHIAIGRKDRRKNSSITDTIISTIHHKKR